MRLSSTLSSMIIHSPEDPAMTEGTRWTPPGTDRVAERCPQCGAPKWVDEPCLEPGLHTDPPSTGLFQAGPPLSPYAPGGWVGGPPPGWTPPPTRKRRHVFRWIFLAVQVLFLAWIIGGVASSGGTPPSCVGMTGQDLTTCQDAGHLGTTFGVALIVFFWLAVDVILAVGHLIFRKRS